MAAAQRPAHAQQLPPRAAAPVAQQQLPWAHAPQLQAQPHVMVHQPMAAGHAATGMLGAQPGRRSSKSQVASQAASLRAQQQLHLLQRHQQLPSAERTPMVGQVPLLHVRARVRPTDARAHPHPTPQ